VKIEVSTKALEITPSGVLVSNIGGTHEIKADSVIYATGVVARDKAAADLSGCAGEFYQIGDCFDPSVIVNATQTAYQIARDIGRI